MAEHELFPTDSFRYLEVSYSKLALFLQCARRYQHQLDGPGRTVTRYYHAVGRNIHGSLAALFRDEATRGQRPDLATLRRSLEEHWSCEGFESLRESREWMDRSLEMLVSFYDKGFGSGEVIDVEVSLKATIPQHGLILRAKVDRLDRVESGVEIIDYKVEIADLVRKMPRPQDTLQWVIYWLAAKEQIRPLRPTKFSFIDLANSEKFSIEPTEADLQEGLQEVVETVGRIQATSRFEPAVNAFCFDCEIRWDCSAYQGRAEGSRVRD